MLFLKRNIVTPRHISTRGCGMYSKPSPRAFRQSYNVRSFL